MSMPAVGEVVTLFVDGGYEPGTIVRQDYRKDGTTCVWEPRDRRTRRWLHEDHEGTLWLRGAGPEVEGALLATRSLLVSR